MGVNVSCSVRNRQIIIEGKNLRKASPVENINQPTKLDKNRPKSPALGHVSLSESDRKMLLHCWNRLNETEKREFVEEAFVMILIKSKLIRQSFGVTDYESSDTLKSTEAVQSHVNRLLQFLSKVMDHVEKGKTADVQIAYMCKKIGPRHAKVNRLAWGVTSFQLFIWGICQSITASMEAQNPRPNLSQVHQSWERLMQMIVVNMRESLYRSKTRHGGMLLPLHRPITLHNAHIEDLGSHVTENSHT